MRIKGKWSRLAMVVGVCVGLSGQVIAGPMNLEGQFAVNQSGAATYTIPIQVPPGIAGIEPKLSLNYNSQSGNGLLGVGWSLGGLSAITRCPRTMAQDNVRGSVNFDLNDRYCLDGQRLIAINGADGGDGTEYRTEVESYSKIISYGSAGNGPAWFKVWTKSGQIVEYGNTADSRIEAIKAVGSNATWPSTTVRAWVLNKISDTKGNYLTYTYTEDTANGDYYPQRIDYTGNATTGQATTNSVLFSYEAKPIPTITYQVGSFVSSKTRVLNITTYANAVSIEKYTPRYEPLAGTAAFRVVGITQCSMNPTVCQPETQFLIQQPNNPGAFQFWTASTNNESGATNNFDHYFIDVNGDGLADWIQVSKTSNLAWVGLSRGDGTFQFWTNLSTARGASNNYQHYFADVNGDGLLDWIQVSRTTNDGWVGLSNGDGTFGAWTASTNNESGATNNFDHYFVDVNGDGLADWIQVSKTSNLGWIGKSVAPIDHQSVQVQAASIYTSSFSFSSLVGSSVFVKDSGANASVYPKVDLQYPLYVVSSVSQSNGIGGTTTTNYTYGGLKAEQGTGRGSLGFRWMDSTQVETGLTSHTEYHQDWPYIGLPSLSQTKLSGAGNSGLLSQTTYSYGCLNPKSGAVCAITPGNGYFPYVTQSLQSSWDLNGATLPIVTTTNQFDQYGNATQVTVGTGDGYSKTTTNQYLNDTTHWYLGRLTRSQVQSTTP
jgi:hypothetical protein